MYSKYLEQETARLLEESGRSEDDEDIDLLVGGASPFAFLAAKYKDISFSPHESNVVYALLPSGIVYLGMFDRSLGPTLEMSMYPHTHMADTWWKYHHYTGATAVVSINMTTQKGMMVLVYELYILYRDAGS